jgi:hypothetical protein
MPLGTFRPGYHTVSWNAVSLGLTVGDGIKLSFRRKAIAVQNTNAYGDSRIDGIHRGWEARLGLTLKEFNAAAQAAMWPFSPGTPAVFDGIIGKIGFLDSALGKALVLVAESLSPAATNSPSATFTAGLAMLSAENDLDFLFGPVECDMPIQWDLMVYDDAGTKRLFKWG